MGTSSFTIKSMYFNFFFLTSLILYISSLLTLFYLFCYHFVLLSCSFCFIHVISLPHFVLLLHVLSAISFSLSFLFFHFFLFSFSSFLGTVLGFNLQGGYFSFTIKGMSFQFALAFYSSYFIFTNVIYLSFLSFYFAFPSLSSHFF